MQTRPSSKPSVVWATALIDRLATSPALRAGLIIVGIQVLLTAITIAAFGWGLSYAQEQTVLAITQHLAQAVASPGTLPGDLPSTITNVREQAFSTVFLFVAFLTALFSYIVTRFALRPTRKALTSQKRFIGDIAHELRTPLAVIKTSTEVALFDPNVTPDTRSLLESTLVEIDRVSEIIHNLLSMNSFASPQAFTVEPVSLPTLIESVVERHQKLANSRGIALSVDAASVPPAEGNAVALEQVITNLVKNAITYTPANQGGKVIIMLRSEYKRDVLSVTDTGTGISRKDLQHLFEPFYRGDTSRARGVGSGTSGLGLAIVNEIVRMHHGSIRVQSALGQGSTFTIMLPQSENGENTETSVEDEEHDVNEVSFDFSKSS
jgi:signal transduction histidine kinase